MIRPFYNLGHLRLRLLYGSDLNKKILVVRNSGMKIARISSLPRMISYTGFLELQGDDLNHFFRGMENPSHNAWEPKRHSNPTKAREYKEEVESWVIEEITKKLMDLSGEESVIDVGDCFNYSDNTGFRSENRKVEKITDDIETMQTETYTPQLPTGGKISIRDEGNVRNNKAIKEVTVQKHLIAVSAVLSDAKRNEIIPKNPARMIELPPIEKTVQTIPTDAQIKELMNALLDEPEHYRYYYFLAIYTGLRRGELCGLKWSDFQLKNNIPTLVVSRSRSALPYSGVVVKGTKNNKERSILISQDIFDIVQGYWYFKKMQAEGLGIEMSEYLFTDDKDGMIHPDTFSKRLRKIYDKIGFSKDFHLHTLRHYFVTAMLHSGVDKQTVADLAGHGDTSFLERTYCHPQTLAKQKAAVGMANMLFNSTAYIDEDGAEQPVRIA